MERKQEGEIETPYFVDSAAVVFSFFSYNVDCF